MTDGYTGGAGSIPFQVGRGVNRERFISSTPQGIMDELLAPSYATNHYPRDTEDKAPTTAPYGPVQRLGKATRQYQVFALTAELAGADPMQAGGGGTLVAGASVTIRAGFPPELWRVYFLSSAVNQQLFVAPGADANPPAEFAYAAASGVKSDVLEIPGRGMDLTVRAGAGNGAAITVIAVALANVGDKYDDRT